ncbi:hypothetical protein DPX16_8132 [Anabarilius grahami]|uniref:Uncharacterized protein n=1 Tax=Anabarilius grahami TaxID=495550 RepID=A0A3N0Y895_ANAGA|nr:hypothetical protein DPX16_8132 [Anabarilius grahami]
MRIVIAGVQPYIVQTGVDTDGETQEAARENRALKEWVREERAGQRFSDFTFMGGKGVDFYFRKYGSPFKAAWTQTCGPLDQSARRFLRSLALHRPPFGTKCFMRVTRRKH